MAGFRVASRWGLFAGASSPVGVRGPPRAGGRRRSIRSVRPPGLMSGPLPEDLMTDEDGEGFGGTGTPVPPPGEMPTTESIRAGFYVPGVSGRADAGPDAEPGAEEAPGEGDGGAADGEAEAAEAPMERERRTQDMDAELGGRREELLAKLRKLLRSASECHTFRLLTFLL